MGFCHLHGHSTFSFLDGYGTPAQVADRIQELGHTAAAVTDHGNIFAHPMWQKEMKRRDIKPLFGCEFYVCDTVNAEKVDQAMASLGVNSYAHITILALTQAGYLNLLTLQRLSWEHRYYKPRIDWGMIHRYQAGLAVLSGCPMGYPTRLLQKGPSGLDQCVEWLALQGQRIENFYVEIDPSPGWNVSERTTPILVAAAQELKLPLVLTADAHFPRPEDYQAQDTLCAAGMGKRVDDPHRAVKLEPYYYYCSEAELHTRARAVAPAVPAEIWAEALQNTAAIADKSAVELPRAGKVVYVGEMGGRTADGELAGWISDGLIRRLEAGQIERADLDRYAERAHREWETLKRKGFSDYMLVIIDAISHMRRQGALVVTRGSAGGCLILWLTGASVTDPLRHGLSFERFYDESRADPPDVDVDFERGRREEAIQYIRAKYGEANTAHIAALAQLKTKSAVHDVATAHGIDREAYAPLVNALTSSDDDAERQIHEIVEPKALAVLEQYPIFRELVPKLIGQYRQPSIHAAGLLVSSTRLDTAVGLITNKDKGQVVASVDKRAAAELGFTKMDFLSVNALDVVAGAVRRLGKPMEWLESLPLDDPHALEMASAGWLAGVFQLDGASAARVIREIGSDTFADLVAASALCRPGPGDWVGTYSVHKRDRHRFHQYCHPLSPAASAVVRDTFGILIYQEQVMRLAHEVAGLPMAEVQKLRKGVSDKLGTQPDKEKADAWKQEWGQKFMSGAIQHGLAETEARAWWTAIQSHGGYSFNLSHCVTYALVGYWMLYLKAHHPGAFYESYLSLEEDPITLKRLIREFVSTGGQVTLLSPQATQTRFSSPASGTLCGGFLNLRGIGPKTAAKLGERAPFRDWDSLLGALPKAVRERVVKTGAPDGSWRDIQELILLAPWFPVPRLGDDEQALRERFGLSPIGSLAIGESVDGDVAFAGYVTATAFSKDKIIFLLEDETAGVVVRLPNRRVAKEGGDYRELHVGDFIVVRGWWAGDALYVKNRVVVTPAPGKEIVNG